MGSHCLDETKKMNHDGTTKTRKEESDEELPAIRELQNSRILRSLSQNPTFVSSLRGVRCVVVVSIVIGTALPASLFSNAHGAEPASAEQSLDRSWQRIERCRPELGVREVTGFCLEAVGRELHRDHVEPALALIRQLQDRQNESKTYGNFRWRWGDDVVHDLNGVEFVVEQAVLIELRYRDHLSPAAREILRDLLMTAAAGVQAHRVPVSYTNIFLMKCWNLIALGEALDKTDLSIAGYRALDEWLDFTRRYGVVEYNSPTYYGVDLDALGLIARFARQPAGRDGAIRALRYFWTEIAANWYQPGHRLGGAHSRDYDYLTGHGELDRQLVRAGWFADPEMQETIFDQLCQWDPPAALRLLAIATPRSVYQRWGEQPSQWASQYVGRRFSIGVAGATYNNMDKPLAVNLPGGPSTPIVSFFLDGRDDPYGHERINTGSGHPKSLHLMPLLSSVQRASEVLLLAADDDRTRKATKTAKSLTCLFSHVVLPTEAELWIDDKRETFSSSERELELNPKSAVFLRVEDVALGIRIPLAVGTDGKPGRMLLVDDGRPYRVRRLTCVLSTDRPKGQAYVAVWMRADEGLDDDGFARFRRDFRAARSDAQVTDPLVGVEVAGEQGPMKLVLNIAEGERPVSIGGDPHGPHDVLVVNGQEMAHEILGDAKPAR